MAALRPFIKLSALAKHYAAPNGASDIPVLDRVNLEVQEGESIAIVGPSGSGKSTLLHIIGTLDCPSSGQVFLGGNDIGTFDEAQLAAVRNREIGFVFQAHYLLPQCTVLENVLVPTLAGPHSTSPLPFSASSSSSFSSSSSKSGQEDQARDRERAAASGFIVSMPAQIGEEAPYEPPAARAHRLLTRVGLADRLSHHPGQLSGGERQRVAVVRALINQPRLLLADEPTGSLDQTSAEQLAQLLAELNQEEHVTLVLVTHSRDLASRMQRVLELKGGHLLATENSLPASASSLLRG
jgi:lipoprotein-releasing system ATP-binding protein